MVGGDRSSPHSPRQRATKAVICDKAPGSFGASFQWWHYPDTRLEWHHRQGGDGVGRK
ncbi:hypothetical protein [Methanosarcina siciliae]|uniref:hypothetical protein n=1 Tax=Methanosarcina siciliae TaxID=38027 RepID=UPI0012DFF51B|nr:hypothetical protein [Methanosarcina siciliae]